MSIVQFITYLDVVVQSLIEEKQKYHVTLVWEKNKCHVT